MAELTPQERLQPALLDRLSDDNPQAKKEPREARVMTRQRLREAVLRDLTWLFNSTRPSGREAQWDGCAAARRSVLNYGLPAMSGATASTFDVMGLENAIREAVLMFEPRLDAASLQVEALASQIALDHHNQIQVHIRGHMWAQPVPIELLLRTDVDLETGQVEIEDLTR